MKIRIVNLGGIKEGFVCEGIKLYSKRIRYYCDFEIIIPSKRIEASSIDEKLKKQYEFAKEYVGKKDYVILLDLKGKEYTSEDFARHLRSIINSNKDILFLIGGDEGVDERLKKSAHLIFSLSKLTFNHEIATLIVCEAIYRSFCILSNHPYHR